MKKPSLLERDMLQKPFIEVENNLKNASHDLAVGHMATISGIRGNQFGREIFSTVLKFKDLMDFLQVFPDVQRGILLRRVNKIKNYVLSGLEDKSTMRFSSAITATARGNIFYDESTQKVAIDTQNSKLSINDGQHRFHGISEAIRELHSRVNRAKDVETYEKYSTQLATLRNMVIPIVIFNNITESEEKQLFHDLNNLQQRPSRSATIKLAQTDLVSIMARELSEENEYLVRYGVEYDKMSIHKKNTNTILLTTVFNVVKFLYWDEYLKNRDFLTKENYQVYKSCTDTTLSEMFKHLPSDVNTKGKYLIEKNYTLKGIAKFIHHCRKVLQVEDKAIYKAISKVNWKYDIEYWKNYEATLSQLGFIQFPGNGEGGITSVFNACMDNLHK